MFNQMNSNKNIITLARLLLLYVCLINYVEGGGKGKVPVYMPIPIPIPMPMRQGDSGGGGGPAAKYHHNNHQNNDGEGEVKKIYLLHPMPKQHSNMNNHEQPMQANPFQAQQVSNQHHSASKGQMDMKILPIVVIPPIAPMPPIQYPSQSNSHTSVPKMTLSPQFNNYLLSNSEPVDRKSLMRARGGAGSHSHQHQNSYYQDHRNFADYGGSGHASMYRRERMARPRARQSGGNPRQGFDYIPRARVRIQEDFGVVSGGDDYDYSPSSWRPRGSSSSRSSVQQLNSRRARLRANSIRDLMELPTVFDDEPSGSLDIGESKEIGSNRPIANGRSSLVVNGRSVNLDNLDDRAERDMGDRDYIDNPSMVSSNSRNVVADNRERSYNGGSGGDGRQRGQSENTLYYDRDYQQSLDEPPGRLSIKYTSNSGASGLNGTKRLYLDDREIMDDDEWRFDSIKTVTHESPNSIELKQNTTTIVPPK